MNTNLLENILEILMKVLFKYSHFNHVILYEEFIQINN
jgi:hypothetical protein